jgi:non-heme chloroperoxidase
VTLVGHSSGCGEAIRYLTRHGDDRIANVAFVAPLGPFPLRADDNPIGLDPALVEAVRASWKQDFPAWMDAGGDGYVGRGLPGCNVSDGLVEWTKSDMLQTSLLAAIEFNRTSVETDLRPELTKISVPTLIIQGDHDMSIPLELSGRVCAELINGAELIVYENAPHGLYLTHRDRLNEDLLRFITR